MWWLRAFVAIWALLHLRAFLVWFLCRHWGFCADIVQISAKKMLGGSSERTSSDRSLESKPNSSSVQLSCHVCHFLYVFRITLLVHWWLLLAMSHIWRQGRRFLIFSWNLSRCLQVMYYVAAQVEILKLVESKNKNIFSRSARKTMRLSLIQNLNTLQVKVHMKVIMKSLTLMRRSRTHPPAPSILMRTRQSWSDTPVLNPRWTKWY